MAAFRKQAPVVVANLVDVMAGQAPSARYGLPALDGQGMLRGIA